MTAVKLFAIRFASPMSDADSELLDRLLQLSMTLRPFMRPTAARPGVARLDHHSGLFLERDDDDRWLLEARTWGRPPAHRVRWWRIRALRVARELDPEAELVMGVDDDDQLRSCCRTWLGEQSHHEYRLRRAPAS